MSGSSHPGPTIALAGRLALLVVALLSLDCAGGISRITVFDRYTVTSALMLGPGKRPLTACRMIALSLPPAFYGPVVVNAWLQRARPHVGSFIRGGRP
jgi:hypothetical protein